MDKPKTVPATNVVSIDRKPSTDERAKIRAALDHHFDDSTGRYLDGMSDEAIAKQLNLPRKFVEDLRETAYGPIRHDPAIEKFKAEIAVLEKRQAELEARYSVVKDTTARTLSAFEAELASGRQFIADAKEFAAKLAVQ